MINNLKNIFDFYIRSKIHLSRKNYIEKNKRLIERNLKENLYTKDVLEKYLTKINKKTIHVLDVGSKNWFYVKGEYDFFSNNEQEVFIDGVEIDAYRLYSNFYNRFELAKYYIKDLQNVEYIAGDVLDVSKKYDYIIWFLPFVFVEPHLKWGLPLSFFQPEKLLSHVYNLLEINGQMLIVNQGEIEAQEQRALLNKLNIKYEYLGEIESPYFQYKNKRYGFLVSKIS